MLVNVTNVTNIWLRYDQDLTNIMVNQDLTNTMVESSPKVVK